MSEARIPTGLPGLDERIEGGFLPGRAVVVCGEVGTGKTTLATQFLRQGLERGEKGVMLSVDQKAAHLLDDAARLGWDLRPPLSTGALAVLEASPYFAAARGRAAPGAQEVAADLAREVKRTGARRLAVDTLSSLALGIRQEQLPEFLRSLFHALEDNLGCTILMTCSNGAGERDAMAMALAERLASGVLELRLDRPRGRLQRTFRLRKMRGTAVEPFESPYAIRPAHGLVLEGGPRP